MRHFIGLTITTAVILAIGLAAGVSLRPASLTVASAAEGPLVDGQSRPAAGASLPEPAAPDAPLAGAILYRSYAANEFHSTHSDLTFASYGPAIYALAIPGGGFSFKLPLDLPNAAQVSRITVYLVDNDNTHNMSIQFYRVKLSDATQIELELGLHRLAAHQHRRADRNDDRLPDRHHRHASIHLLHTLCAGGHRQFTPDGGSAGRVYCAVRFFVVYPKIK